MKPKLLLIGILPILFSCTKNLDFNNIDNFEYKGEWIVPVVNANLKLENVVANDSNFVIDSDGGLRIIYQEDSLFSQSTADLAQIPDQEPQKISLPADAPPFILNTELATIAGAKIKNVTILQGDFKWKLNNPSSQPVTIEFSVLNADLKNDPTSDTAIFTLTSNGMGESSGVIDIASLDFDFTVGTTGYNALSYRMRIVNNGGAPASTVYDVEIQLADVIVEDAIGYFGQRTINIPSGVLDPQISGFENFLTGLYLENPTIELIINGNVGLPLEFRPNMDGVNKVGNVVALDLKPQSYYGPTISGDWDTSKIVIDNTTSNIVNFIANVPNSIVYAGEIELNPLGETGFDNFVEHDGEITVGMRLDLPLELRTKDMVLEQWIYDFDLGVEEDDVDIIDKLDLFFKVTNGFPFDSDLELMFVDSISDIALDSVKIELFNSAIVDNDGRVTDPTVSRNEVNFTSENISNLLNANKLLIRVKLNSVDNGNRTVKLYSDYNIGIALGVGVKLKVKALQ